MREQGKKRRVGRKRKKEWAQEKKREKINYNIRVAEKKELKNKEWKIKWKKEKNEIKRSKSSWQKKKKRNKRSIFSVCWKENKSFLFILLLSMTFLSKKKGQKEQKTVICFHITTHCISYSNLIRRNIWVKLFKKV